MSTIASGGLIERDAEVAQASTLVEGALAGSGCCALVLGPAGIGKTTVLGEAVRAGDARGMLVLKARASELERELPFGVVRQLLERLLLESDLRRRTALLEGAAGLAGPVFGLEPPTLPAAAIDQPFAAIHGLYWLTAGLAAERPTLLAVDDLQWCDASSLRWLAYLARRLEGVPLLLCATARDGELDSTGVVAALLQEPAAVTIRLASLSEAGSATLVTATMPSATPEFCASCHAIAGGNPFYLRELAAAAAQAGIEPTPAGARRLESLGPERVRASVLDRVRRHGPEAERMARAIAVLETDASLRRTGQLADLDEQRATTRIDNLVAAQVLYAECPFEFVHPVVRAAIYHDIPPGERLRLHAAAVSVLRASGVPPERIARHLLLTEPSGDATVIETLRAAAAGAQQRGAPDLAARYLDRALAESRATPEARASAAEGTIIHDLGRAQLANRDPQAFEHLRAAIGLGGEAERRDQWSLELVRALGVAARPAEAIEFATRALAEGIEDRTIEIKLESELLANAWLLPDATAAGVERLERLETATIPPELAPYVELHRALRLTADCAPTPEPLAMADRALSGGVLLETDSSLPFVVLITLIWNDDLERPLQLCDAALAVAQQMGSQHLTVNAGAFGGLAALRTGSLARAAGLAGISYEFSRESAMPGSVDWAWALAVLIDAMRERGEVDAAQELLRDADAEGELPGHVTFQFLRESRGRLRCAQGRLRDGVEDLLSAGRLWEPLGLRNPNVSPWRSDAAAALLGLGERERAQALVEEELALARAAGTARGLGIATLTAGLVHREDDLLEESVATLERSPDRLAYARALCELGVARRRASRAAHARQPLSEALEIASRCTAAPLAQRIRQELAAIGSRPRRDFARGVEALTPSELRVALLAADGRTNKQIAQALFLTLRTVETHLTHVYRKLDISSRTELTGALGSMREAA